MCGCECCISSKIVHLSLLSWREHFLKNLKIQVVICKTESLMKWSIIYSIHIKILLCHMLSIRGAFYDKYPRFSGFGFCRKLARTKIIQGTDKESKMNGRNVKVSFSSINRDWCQICFILFIDFYLR